MYYASLYKKLFILLLLNTAAFGSINLEDLREETHKEKINIALQRSEALIDYLQDFNDTFKDNKAACISPHLVPKNIQSVTNIKLALEVLTLQPEHTELILRKLLHIRFEFLDVRRNVIKAKEEQCTQRRQTSSKGTISVGLTLPSVYEKLNPTEQYQARFSTDMYQYINSIIMILWSSLTPEQIKPKTRLLLQCSKSLWPNFTGEREDLGHPDEAIITYYWEQGQEKDWYYYDTYLKASAVKVPMKQWTRQSQSIYITPYERSLGDPGYNKISPPPMPEWLEKKPVLQEVKELTSIPEPTPVVDETKVVKAPVAPVASEPQKKLEEKDFSENLPAAPRLIEVKEGKQEVKKTEKEATNVSSLAPPRPKGMRTFHGQAPTPKVYAFNKLSNSKQTLIDNIFDAQRFRGITFGDIKKLWRHAFGDKYPSGKPSIIESTGSSHKVFVGPSGEKFGLFAHGDAMTYSPKTIKYVRDMLRQVGLGA